MLPNDKRLTKRKKEIIIKFLENQWETKEDSYKSIITNKWLKTEIIITERKERPYFAFSGFILIINERKPHYFKNVNEAMSFVDCYKKHVLNRVRIVLFDNYYLNPSSRRVNILDFLYDPVFLEKSGIA